MSARYSCLGPQGSYSELAALRFSGGEGEIVLCPDFYAAVSALQKGEADFAVLPIENSIQGGVLKNLDLLERPDAPFAVEEPETDQLTTSAESIFSASSNETRVRVEFSKKRFTHILPRRAGTFFTGLSITFSI